MAALTEKANRGVTGAIAEYITGADDTYYNGAFLTIGSDGKAKNAAGPTEVVLGVYAGNERKVEADDTDKRLRVLIGGIVHIESATIADTQTNLGELVTLLNNNDVKVRTNTTDKVLGKIINLNSVDNIVTIDTSQKTKD